MVLEPPMTRLMLFSPQISTPILPSAIYLPMAMPASYTGDTACGGFLLQVVLYIEMQSQKFSSKRAKVAFLISLLKGKALLWEKAIWNADSAIINSYDAFMNHSKEVFGHETPQG
uniref:DUF4939 domain-containing protein n=1 Tax=Cyprinus carpio TaxID=7962 RepID=A0A8C1ITY2_CYPCA